jgi:acetoin utilization protein AcuB
MSADDRGTIHTVAEVMSRDVVSVTPKTSLLETIGTMVQKGIRHLPVMEAGRLVGVVSDRDIRMQISGATDPGERQRYLASTNVMARAIRAVTTVAPDCPVQDAARIFIDEHIGCLPVVDEEDRVMGIVTQTDLLKWLAALTS